MDIYCSQCGEPWELDSLHEAAEEQGETFATVRQAFTTRGCSAVGGRCSTQPNESRAQLAAVAYDLLGDDVDGAASMLEDAETMGLMD